MSQLKRTLCFGIAVSTVKIVFLGALAMVCAQGRPLAQDSNSSQPAQEQATEPQTTSGAQAREDVAAEVHALKAKVKQDKAQVRAAERQYGKNSAEAGNALAQLKADQDSLRELERRRRGSRLLPGTWPRWHWWHSSRSHHRKRDGHSKSGGHHGGGHHSGGGSHSHHR